jgi:hypothetical protein
MRAQVFSALIVVLASAVCAYIIAVAQRAGGEFTTLGLDVICVVWVATIILSSTGLFQWLRNTADKKRAVVHLLSIFVPLASLFLWSWLIFTGRVVSHGAMMAAK